MGNAGIRPIVTEQLESPGYQVCATEHGAAALEILHRGDAIDLLLTDITLPGGMNGLELATLARAVRPAIKVLYSSGLGEEALRRERAGCAHLCPQSRLSRLHTSQSLHFEPLSD